MKLTGLFGVVMLPLVLLSIAPAQENQHVILHSAINNPWGGSCDMVVEDNYAYIAAPRNGVRILNVSNPINPTEVGIFHTDLEVLRINIVDDICYVLCFPSTLKLIDISDPGNPNLLGTWVHENEGACDFTVDGLYAYVTFENDNGDNFYILDVSNPADPATVSAFATGVNSYYVDAEGFYAYLSNYQYGLIIIDVSDPENPNQAGALESGMETGNLEVSGDYAYVVGANGLLIIDIWDPSRPVIVNNIINVGLQDVVISGSSVYATGEVTVHVDISSPGNLVILETVRHFTNGCGISEENGYAFVFLETGSLVVSDLNYWPRYEDYSRYESSGVTTSAAFLNGFLYLNGPVAGSVIKNHLRIYDVTNADAPHENGSLPIGDMIYGIAVEEEYAFIAYTDSAQMPIEHGLQIVDIGNPANPFAAGSLHTDSPPEYGVVVNGNTAYLGISGEGLAVVNITDIEEPFIEGYDPFGAYTRLNFAAFSHYLIITGEAEEQPVPLRVLDVYYPADIQEVARIDSIQGAVGVAIDGDYVYLGYDGLTIFDISDPLNWEVLGSQNEVTGDYIALSGDTVFMTSRNDKELYVLDVANPFNPTLVGNHHLEGDVRDLACNGAYAYVADTWFVEIFEYNEEYGIREKIGELPDEFAVAAPYPNPFNSTVTVNFFIPQSGIVETTVFDILGREINRTTAVYSTGAHHTLFHAGSSRYSPGSGIYFIQLKYDGKNIVRRATLLK